MEKIVIKPDGAFYAYLDEDTNEWKEKDLINSTLPISWYLPMQLEVHMGVSIKRILDLFERYNEQLSFIYARALKTLTMDDVTKILAEVPDAESSTLKSTCVVWVGDIHPSKEEDEEDDELITITTALIGMDTVGLEEMEEIDEGVFQLTNFNIAEWIKLPLYIDEYIDFVRVGEETEALKGTYFWTLHDLFDCILNEISLTMFVSGLATSPDVEVLSKSAQMNISEFFDFLDDLDDLSDK